MIFFITIYTNTSHPRKMHQMFQFAINEVNLKEACPAIYKNSVFLYDINIKSSIGAYSIGQIRLVDIFKVRPDKNYVIFRFINMNKYGRHDYRKFSDSYTQFDLDIDNQILTISFYTYFVLGDENSKEVMEILHFDIRKCEVVNRFFYYLYNKFGKEFSAPAPRM